MEGDGDCFKVLKVENAYLSDLRTVFLAAVEGFTVLVGTIILISSIIHLAGGGGGEHFYEKQTCISEGFGNQVSLCQPIDEAEEC